jgi:hypothetical protein
MKAVWPLAFMPLRVPCAMGIEDPSPPPRGAIDGQAE